MTSFVMTTITLTIILFLSPTLLPTAKAYNIRDVTGRKVLNGANYYIKSNTPGPNDGSITWAYNASSTQTCPLFVTQSYYDINTLATISSYQTRSTYIPVGYMVDITFQDNTSPCRDSRLYWTAVPTNSIANALYVVVGTSLGYDGAFQVDDSGLNQKNVYKLSFCTENQGCFNVGWLANSNDPYLAMTNDPNVELNPFYFVFVKA